MKVTIENIKKLSHIKQVKFALFCAMQVKHLMKDERSLDALVKVELFIEGKITREEFKLAADAAYADAADAAAAAAAAAAYAAAADAAAAAAYASYYAAVSARAAYASYYAAVSARAAYAAAAAAVKEKQSLYLDELFVEESK